MTVTEDLVEWAWALKPSDVPTEIRHAVARHFTDAVGCALGAQRLDAVPFAMALATGSGTSGVLGSETQLDPASAAFVNGTLVHGLDFDDTHADALVHATAAVLPTTLALAQADGSTGAETVTTAVIGYETVLRIGATVRNGFHARGFHATSICGVFSSAMVAARLLGLTIDQAVNALGIAGSMASGSLEFLHTGSSTKQLHPGWSGRSGIEAARLAQAGATGPVSILEGEYGLFQSYTGHQIDPSTLTKTLGQEWETGQITMKPYPLCQLSHASLDAIGQLALTPDQVKNVERITVAIPSGSVPVVLEPFDQKVAPRTPYEAKFSLPWQAGALLIDGAITTDTFHPDRIDRSDVRAIASRVEYRVVDSGVAPAAAPGHALIRVGAEVHEGSVACSRGGPTAPLSDADVVAKFVGNAGSYCEDPGQVAEAWLALDDAASLDPLLLSIHPVTSVLA